MKQGDRVRALRTDGVHNVGCIYTIALVVKDLYLYASDVKTIEGSDHDDMAAPEVRERFGKTLRVRLENPKIMILGDGYPYLWDMDRFAVVAADAVDEPPPEDETTEDDEDD